MTKAAGVGQLVLYHVGSGIPDSFLIKKKFLEGMSDIYPGPIIVAKDTDRLYLEPGSNRQ